MVLRWSAIGARVLVGVVFLLAGGTKVVAPGSFAAALLAYDLLPFDLLAPVALILPWIEIAIGLLLLVGRWMTMVGSLAIGLLGLFVLAIGQALLRGRSLEGCGCFGDLASAVPALGLILGNESAGPADIVRDLVFVALVVFAMIAGRRSAISNLRFWDGSNRSVRESPAPGASPPTSDP